MSPTEFELKAGRELDALVAEKVFGWKPSRPKCPSEHFDEYCEFARCCDCGGLVNWSAIDIKHFDERNASPRSYSTDIAAAWEVVRAMKNRKGLSHDDLGFSVSIASGDSFPDRFSVGFSHLDRSDLMTENGSFDDVPFLICLAALKALE